MAFYSPIRTFKVAPAKNSLKGRGKNFVLSNEVSRKKKLVFRLSTFGTGLREEEEEEEEEVASAKNSQNVLSDVENWKNRTKSPRRKISLSVCAVSIHTAFKGIFRHGIDLFVYTGSQFF